MKLSAAAIPKLTTPISELFSFRSKPHKHRIGVELEVEGSGIPFEGWAPKYWKLVPEGSLRNGWEFVTGPQCTIGNFQTYLDDLELALSKAKLDLSIRTSTHLHVNVYDFTLEQVYAVIAAFYLMEDTLVKANGKARMGNLFCLRAKDAEGIFEILNNNATTGRHVSVDHNLRYGALNLNAIQKFGSVEFRFMRALTDTKLLKIWVENLHQMVHRARSLGSMREVISQYKRASSDLSSFYALFFTPEFIRMIRSHITPDHEILPYIIVLDKTLKTLDKPKKIKYNFKVQEDLDEFAVKEFAVPVNNYPAKTNLNLASMLVSSSTAGQGTFGNIGIPGPWIDEITPEGN